MERFILLLIVATAFCFSSLARAQGRHVDGYVNINGNYMYGTMNNRYNTTPTTYDTYIYASGVANSTVSFFGQDGDGDFFSCFVPTTSALYASAVDIARNMRNGSHIYVTENTTTNECTYLSYVNGSQIMD